MKKHVLLIALTLGLFNLAAQNFFHSDLLRKCKWDYYQLGDTIFWVSKACCADFSFLEPNVFQWHCQDDGFMLRNLTYKYNTKTQKAVCVSSDIKRPDSCFSLCHFKRGKREGLLVSHYLSGYNYAKYRNNRLSGFEVWKLSDGRLERKNYYFRDQLWGKFVVMYYDSNAKITEFYIDGKSIYSNLRAIDKTKPIQ